MEDFNIYDDLELLHEQEKDRYLEDAQWKEKYNVALNTIQKLQVEKKELNKKNKQLEINFTNLLETARTEIRRKDYQINELRKEKDDICFRRYSGFMSKTKKAVQRSLQSEYKLANSFSREQEKYNSPNTQLTDKLDEKNIQLDSKVSNVYFEETKKSKNTENDKRHYREKDKNQHTDQKRFDKYKSDTSEDRLRALSINENKNNFVRAIKNKPEEILNVQNESEKHGKNEKYERYPNQSESAEDYQIKPEKSKHKYLGSFIKPLKDLKYGKQKSSKKDEHELLTIQKPESIQFNSVLKKTDFNSESTLNNESVKIAIIEKNILKDVNDLKKMKITKTESKNQSIDTAKLKSDQFLDALFEDEMMNEENAGNLYENLEPTSATENKTCNNEFKPLKQSAKNIFDDFFEPSLTENTGAATAKTSTSITSQGDSSDKTFDIVTTNQNRNEILGYVKKVKSLSNNNEKINHETNNNIDVREPIKSVERKENLRIEKETSRRNEKGEETFKFIEFDSSFYSSEEEEKKIQKKITNDTNNVQMNLESPIVKKNSSTDDKFNFDVTESLLEPNFGQERFTSKCIKKPDEKKSYHEKSSQRNKNSSCLTVTYGNKEFQHSYRSRPLREEESQGKNHNSSKSNSSRSTRSPDRHRSHKFKSECGTHRSRSKYYDSIENRREYNDKEKSRRHYKTSKSSRTRSIDSGKHSNRDMMKTHKNAEKHHLKVCSTSKPNRYSESCTPTLIWSDDQEENKSPQKTKDSSNQDLFAELELYQEKIIFLQHEDISDEDNFSNEDLSNNFNEKENENNSKISLNEFKTYSKEVHKQDQKSIESLKPVRNETHPDLFFFNCLDKCKEKENDGSKLCAHITKVNEKTKMFNIREDENNCINESISIVSNENTNFTNSESIGNAPITVDKDKLSETMKNINSGFVLKTICSDNPSQKTLKTEKEKPFSESKKVDENKTTTQSQLGDLLNNSSENGEIENVGNNFVGKLSKTNKPEIKLNYQNNEVIILADQTKDPDSSNIKIDSHLNELNNEVLLKVGNITNCSGSLSKEENNSYKLLNEVSACSYVIAKEPDLNSEMSKVQLNEILGNDVVYSSLQPSTNDKQNCSTCDKMDSTVSENNNSGEPTKKLQFHQNESQSKQKFEDVLSYENSSIKNSTKPEKSAIPNPEIDMEISHHKRYTENSTKQDKSAISKLDLETQSKIFKNLEKDTNIAQNLDYSNKSEEKSSSSILLVKDNLKNLQIFGKDDKPDLTNKPLKEHLKPVVTQIDDNKSSNKPLKKISSENLESFPKSESVESDRLEYDDVHFSSFESINSSSEDEYISKEVEKTVHKKSVELNGDKDNATVSELKKQEIKSGRRTKLKTPKKCIEENNGNCITVLETGDTSKLNKDRPSSPCTLVNKIDNIQAQGSMWTDNKHLQTEAATENEETINCKINEKEELSEKSVRTCFFKNKEECLENRLNCNMEITSRNKLNKLPSKTKDTHDHKQKQSCPKENKLHPENHSEKKNQEFELTRQNEKQEFNANVNVNKNNSSQSYNKMDKIAWTICDVKDAQDSVVKNYANNETKAYKGKPISIEEHNSNTIQCIADFSDYNKEQQIETVAHSTNSISTMGSSNGKDSCKSEKTPKKENRKNKQKPINNLLHCTSPTSPVDENNEESALSNSDKKILLKKKIAKKRTCVLFKQDTVQNVYIDSSRVCNESDKNIKSTKYKKRIIQSFNSLSSLDTPTENILNVEKKLARYIPNVDTEFLSLDFDSEKQSLTNESNICLQVSEINDSEVCPKIKNKMVISPNIENGISKDLLPIDTQNDDTRRCNKFTVSDVYFEVKSGQKQNEKTNNLQATPDSTVLTECKTSDDVLNNHIEKILDSGFLRQEDSQEQLLSNDPPHTIYIKRKFRPRKQSKEIQNKRKHSPVPLVENYTLPEQKKRKKSSDTIHSLTSDCLTNCEISPTCETNANCPLVSSPKYEKIFNKDNYSKNPPSVYNASEDDLQYQEIDNRMRSMFQSPTYIPANGSNSFEEMNSAADLKYSDTVEETLVESEKSQCDTSITSKKMSVGSNDYVIESVGTHTANVFITRRKCKKKRKIPVCS